MRHLVSTEDLAARLGDPGLRVVDLRWSLDASRRGRDAYLSGHLPGAVFMDLDADLAAPGGGVGRPVGRHPWPSTEQVARVLGAAGVGPETTVVAYDDQAGTIAARLWYVLEAHGHERAAILDGGITKWVAEGRALETEVPTPAPAVFTPRPRPGWVVTLDEVRRPDPARLLLDARSPERYRGDSEPVDARAGHIPGAVNVPCSGNLTDDAPRVFRSPGELRGRFMALNVAARNVVVYCGSGVTACHDLLALRLCGLGGRLYAGSWSEWSSHPELPVETGSGRA